MQVEASGVCVCLSLIMLQCNKQKTEFHAIAKEAIYEHR